MKTSTNPHLSAAGIASQFKNSDAAHRAGISEVDLQTAQADFEHGQWWIQVLATGESFAVVTVVQKNGEMDLDFEQL